MTEHLPEAIAATVVLIATAITNHIKGQKRERSHNARLEAGFSELRQTVQTTVGDLRVEMNERFSETNAAVAEVRGFCVGPDGQNGFRKEISELREDVRGVLERERDRLERKAYDRRTST